MSDSKAQIETITPLGKSSTSWAPTKGDTVSAFLARQTSLNSQEQERLLRETIKILGKCTPPNVANGSKTGLVVGYVQSGKTMSFTALTALARDNKYPLIIILSGTKNNLYMQSWERLHKDLQVDADNKWINLGEPTLKEASNIAGILKTHSSEKDATTCLIVTKKIPKRLQNLIGIFSRVKSEVDLRSIPVLIIDDEGDQAGMNTLVNDGDFSPTYEKILELKSTFPSHTYVHYTATPQAPLLINITDLLSPEFAEVITPGGDYVGGDIFFAPTTPYIRTIPQTDLALSDEDVPPDSLREALRCYYVGLADAIAKEETGRGKRSMMIHPSGNIAPHAQYERWVKAIKGEWESILSSGPSDDLDDLKADFEISYKDLRKTVHNLSEFSDIFPKLEAALTKCRITRLNSQRDSKNFNWGGYAHMIIGGNMLDRGFTVEGLTVTYMPRGEGAAQADTIQQRARFFGYKKKYLGFCRVYLTEDLRKDYFAYVDHEKCIHELLRKCQGASHPLKEAKRVFFLDRKLSPTRENVMNLGYSRLTGPDWLKIERVLSAPDNILANNKLVSQFIQKFTARFKDNDLHGMKHLRATIPLKEVLDNLLVDFKISNPYESAQNTARLISIGRLLTQAPDEKAVVYLMSCDKIRERAEGKDKSINNLHQGRSGGYPGDSEVYEKTAVTVQIHHIGIKPHGKPEVYTIALRIPHVKDLFIQQGK